jgi:hypothetical protein
MMKRPEVRKALDVVASISMIVASVALIWYVISARSQPGIAGGPRTYQTGDRLDKVSELRIGASPRTLIVWIRTGCRFCTESMPFYTRLSRQPRRSRIVVVGLEPSDQLRSYTDSHGFSPDEIVTVQPGALQLTGTPTLVLVNASGVVLKVWKGKLPNAASEEEVRRSLE